ncbi:MAG: hypothetical protein A2Y55_12175 [Actinobacteria bacterium RBG_16_68_12]|nr:MAG: hypothetical protein A2Y55_12175 [Actinobacteria bacterium RBG_16_68_12]
MTDDECVEFLQWALPRLHMRWAGFRKVRRQVCRRIERRLLDLDLSDVTAYRAYLEATPEEWQSLDALCGVTISRFYRDRGVFEFLERSVLPQLAAETATRGAAVEAWSAGCASGEEPYTLVLVWEYAVRPSFPAVGLHVLATDADETMIRRARAASYGESSLRELPSPWRRRGFVRRGGRCHLRPRFRQPVTVERHDVRDSIPNGPYDLVLCRNLAFTYFELPLQREVAERLALALRSGGALVVGSHETLPEGSGGLIPWCARLGVYRSSA